MLDQAYKLREYYNSPVSNINLKDRQIISITSGKGGTGKSFLAFYLSQFLVKQGFKTLLVEFDFNLGSLSFHLNINPKATIGDFFAGSVLLDEAVVNIDKNFDVILSDNGKLNFPDNRISHIRNFFSIINNKEYDYDFIILDNGAGISKEIFESIKHSTMNIIVTLPNTVAVMDAYVLVKLMAKNSLPVTKGIVINRCASQSEGSTAFDNLNKASRHFLKEDLNFIGQISEDPFANTIKLFSSTELYELNNSSIVTELHSAASVISKFGQMANSHQPNFK